MANDMPVYDPMEHEGQPIPVLQVGDGIASATFSVAQLTEWVLDPIASENPKRTAEDPNLAKYAEIRHEVQRAVQGAKKKNAQSYARYIREGLEGKRPWVVPPITLYHRERLEQVRMPSGGYAALILPYGDFFVAIDGETQAIAWRKVAVEVPAARKHKVAVIIHHGHAVDRAKQSFHDLNTKEVKPNAAVAIGMDTLDHATAITRTLIDHSAILNGRVDLRGRQLRRSQPELMTLSALRTAIVTTILGARGLQIGSRSVNDYVGENVDLRKVEAAVLDVWEPLIEVLQPWLEPERRAESIAFAPAVMAGIGVVAHHAMPAPPRDEVAVAAWPPAEVAANIRDVDFSRSRSGMFPWEGIAGKTSPTTGRFSVGGPKEVGYLVAAALENAGTQEGRRIRT